MPMPCGGGKDDRSGDPRPRPGERRPGRLPAQAPVQLPSPGGHHAFQWSIANPDAAANGSYCRAARDGRLVGGAVSGLGTGYKADSVNGQSRLSVLAVDPDRLALEDLGQLLSSSSRVTESVCACSASEALRLFATREFGALLTEVRMPGFDGLELASVLNRFAHPPAVVFMSANDHGAARRFELRARDYLRKPITQRRLDEAIARILDPAKNADGGAGTAIKPSSPKPVVGVHRPNGDATRIISLSSILYVSAQGDYVRIVTDTGRYLERATITEIDRRWKSYGFHRVHRAYVVNLRRAQEMRPLVGGTASLALVDGSEIPVARRHTAELRRRLRM